MEANTSITPVRPATPIGGTEDYPPVPWWVIAVAAVVVAGIVGAAVLAGIAIDRSTNRPRRIEPAEAAVAQALVTATAGKPTVDVGSVRAAVQQELAGWLPRRIEVAVTHDGRELAATVLVQIDRDRGRLDRNGAQDACLRASIRIGGEADVERAWPDWCVDAPPREWGTPGENGRKQRDNDTEAAVRQVLAGYVGTHRPPYDRAALRATLGDLAVPVETPAVKVALGSLGDIGVSLQTNYQCVMGWLGAAGGLQVWVERAPYCEASAALDRVPLSKP